MLENRIIWQDLLFSQAIEGGLSEPRDGDPNWTNHGITLDALRAWRAPRPVSIQDIKNLTLDEAKVIANAAYWVPVQGDKLPGGIDILVADFCFNSGARQAVKELQRCVGADVDGFIGVQTLKAVQAMDPATLIEAYVTRRLAFMQKLKNWPQNAEGWEKRLARMRDLALHLAPVTAPAVVAMAKNDRSKLISNGAVAGTALATVLPQIVEAIPSAKAAYQSTADLLGPYAATLPWLIPVIGGLVIVGILVAKTRASRLSHATVDTGTAVVAAEA